MRLLTIFMLVILTACGTEDNPNLVVSCEETSSVNFDALIALNCEYISQYSLLSFNESLTANAIPPGLSYSLNSSLFSDHTRKYRFIFMPENKTAKYNSQESFDFPIGTALIKIFSMPFDTSNSAEQIIEIRLLIHRKEGWVALPYIWDESLQDAKLDINGETFQYNLIHEQNNLLSNYTIPTYAGCRTCHVDGVRTTPIGTKARLLNKTISINGEAVNQLQLWQSLGMLEGLPQELSTNDTAPDWQDETANLQDRAKAYLDVNCAHCHSDGGAGALSGLRLEYWRKDIDYSHGVCNSSHGWRGGGFDIWPGDGEISSIPIRMRHTDPKDRMPPIGRSLVDEQAAALVSSWIDSLPYESCAE